VLDGPQGGFAPAIHADGSNGTVEESWMQLVMLVTSSRIQSAMRRAALAQKRITNGGHPPTSRADFSDFNYVRQDGECVAVGPETVPAGKCIRKDDTYMGSSGYRKIPGNTCDRDAGVKMDEPVAKQCTNGKMIPLTAADTSSTGERPSIARDRESLQSTKLKTARVRYPHHPTVLLPQFADCPAPACRRDYLAIIE
jgi:hypothetical protein